MTILRCKILHLSRLIFRKKMKLFPVETSQLLFYPDGGEREKCWNQSKDEIFIVPLENLPCRKNQQKVKGKKQTVDISDGRNINNGQQTISIIADPDHRRKQKCPRNSFQFTNFFEPFDDFFFAMLCQKLIYNLHIIYPRSLFIKTAAVQIFKNFRWQHRPHIFSQLNHLPDFCGRKFNHGCFN